jgi:hypothetical protein
MMFKSLIAMLPLAALGFAAPAPQVPAGGELVPVKTIATTSTSTWATTIRHEETHVATKAPSSPEHVPQNSKELIAVLIKLELDINLKLGHLNDTVGHGDKGEHHDPQEDANLIEVVLHEVILLVEAVVALLGKVVASLIHCTDDEVAQIVKILVNIIASILFTVGFLIKSLGLGNLLGAVLALVANVLVLLLKIVATLVPGVLALVFALLKELGLLQLVGGLLGAVLSLLNVIL